MPFAAPTQFDDPNDPNKKNQQDGYNISGSSNSFATNVPGQNANQGPQKSSGRYANIQSYLDANKPQADEMGQKISTNVSSEADQAQNQIGEFEKQAPTVNSYDPNSALSNLTNLNDKEKQQYKDYKTTGGYTGPQSIDQAAGYDDTMKSATKATQDVKNAGSEIGQQQLLRDTYARPDYSAGQNRLDQVLLQNSAGSKAGLEDISKRYAGLQGALDGSVQKVGDAINQANTQALNNQKAFDPAEQAYRKQLIDPIQARAQQVNADNASLQGRVADDAKDNVLSDETLKSLGLQEGQDIWDLNLGNYVMPDQTQAGLNNVANADERQRYSALQSLLNDPTMTQITADGKAINPVGFNRAQFDKDLAGKAANAKDIYENQTDLVGEYRENTNYDQLTKGLSMKQIEDQLIPHLKTLNLYNHPELGMPSTSLRYFVKDLEEQIAKHKDELGYGRQIKKG